MGSIGEWVAFMVVRLEGEALLRRDECAFGFAMNNYCFHYLEIPRVITALQQQNTAPEAHDYDDDYQTDNNERGMKYDDDNVCQLI